MSAGSVTRLVAALALAVTATWAVPAPASATVSPETNPRAPFVADHVLAAGSPWRPVVIADGTGMLAVYVTRRTDGRHVWVVRWRSHGGWGTPTELFVGSVEATSLMVAARGGLAAVAWYDDVGYSVRRMHVSVRNGAGAAWSTPHQVFRGDTGAVGAIDVGAGTVAVLWNKQVVSPGDASWHGVPTTAVWDAAHGWGVETEVGTRTDYTIDLSAVGDRLVANWDDFGVVRSAAWQAGTWSASQALTDASVSCGMSTSGRSPRRYALVTFCRTGNPATYVVHEWAASGDPPAVQVVFPSAEWPREVVVSDAEAAILSAATTFDQSSVSVLRSSAPGSWSPPRLVTTREYSEVQLALSGAATIVIWIEFDRASRHWRIVGRSTTRASGVFRTRPIGLTPWSAGSFFLGLGAAPSGAVASWTHRVGTTPSQEAATWTARGGWSYSRVLGRAPARPDMPSVGVTASAAMVGWVASGTVDATVAPLSDPAPQGRAVVARRGSTLTCTAPRFAPLPAVVSYRWLANGVAIRGATHRTLVVSGALLGKALRCRVTASTQGFRSGTAYSSAVVVAGK